MIHKERGRASTLLSGKSLLIFLCAGWAFYLSSSQVFLRVENYETHKPLFWIEVKGNDTFSLAFKHSYDKAMYVEHYQIVKGKEFVLTGITFQSDLNGQGFIYPNPRYLSNGWGTFQGLHEVKKKIPFIMGSADQANHTLLIHGKKYLLTRYVEAGMPVALRVERARRYDVYVWRVEKWLR